MIEMGKKYQTRGNGVNIPSLPVRILCVDCKSGKADYPVVGLVFQSDGTEEIHRWGADGSFQSARPYPEDLIPVPTKHEVWCLVDTDAPSYATREEAERAFTTGVYAVWNPCDDRYQIKHVTWED